jgi:hypothetical protein
VPGEHRQELPGCHQLVHRHRHHVAVHVADGVLVEVVTDPRPVRQQVLDRHVVGYQGQVLPEQRAGGRTQLERRALDQAHHGQGREALRPARDGELGLHLVGGPVRPVGAPVGRAELDLARAVDLDHAAEPGALRGRVQRVLK